MRSGPIDGGFMISSSLGNLTGQTRYIYHGCNSTEQGLLYKAVIGAANIAYAGLTVVNPYANSVDFGVDFNTRAAIEYFGPPSENREQQMIRSKYTFLILDDLIRLYGTTPHESVPSVAKYLLRTLCNCVAVLGNFKIIRTIIEELC